MCIRVLAVVFCMAGIACGPRSATPTTEPTAAQPDVAANEHESSAPEDLDDLDDRDDAEDASQEAPSEPSEPDGPLTFKLHNLCKRSVKYGLGPLVRDVEISEPKTIKAGGVETITAERGIGVHLGEGTDYAAAAPKADGGHVWISSSCKGVGSSDDPDADPVQLDRELRERIERLTKGTE
jgi:hypothetical protein